MSDLTGAQLLHLLSGHPKYRGMTDYQIKKKIGGAKPALVGELRKEVTNLGLLKEKKEEKIKEKKKEKKEEKDKKSKEGHRKKKKSKKSKRSHKEKKRSVTSHENSEEEEQVSTIDLIKKLGPDKDKYIVASIMDKDSAKSGRDPEMYVTDSYFGGGSFMPGIFEKIIEDHLRAYNPNYTKLKSDKNFDFELEAIASHPGNVGLSNFGIEWWSYSAVKYYKT